MRLRTLRNGTAVVVLITIVVEMSAGCTASGCPRFVKISPDGRFVVYEDLGYAKTYVYDVVRDRKTVFDARVACMNEDGSLLALRGKLCRPHLKCQLMALEPAGPTVSDVQNIPVSDYDYVRIMFIGNAPNMLALLYESYYAKAPSEALALSRQSTYWEQVPVPQQYRNQAISKISEPVGERLSGHIYSLASANTALGDYGVDVRCMYDRRSHSYFCGLDSPSRDYIVTVNDPDDEWHRLWLTKADGTRILLLDKNNLAQEISEFMINLPGGLVLTLLGVKL